MDRKRRLTFYLLLLLFFISYILIAQKYGTRRSIDHYNKFYEAELNGLIEQVGIKYHGVAFKLDNENYEFVFYPYISSINENHIFNHIAIQGDSIKKPKDSDTLVLIKKDKKYYYTFRKFK